MLFINPVATQAQRLAGPIHVYARQIAPVEADSKAGDRPEEHAADVAGVARRPAAARRTGRQIDLYV